MAVSWDHFQNQRFVLSGPYDEEMPNYYLIITNIKWWLDNEAEIYEWMDARLPNGRLHHTGMVVEIPSEKDCAMFLLKWG